MVLALTIYAVGFGVLGYSIRCIQETISEGKKIKW